MKRLNFETIYKNLQVCKNPSLVLYWLEVVFIEDITITLT
jgi:hypothetical protein